MKSDTERKKYYTEKLHKKKQRLHSHLSRELRDKLKIKKRAILVRKGDSVKIMRGPNKGKDAKIASVSTLKRLVYLEGMTVRNARGKEAAIPFEPSNLLLIAIEPTAERKVMFSDDAFKKKEPKKVAIKSEVNDEVKSEAKSEVNPEVKVESKSQDKNQDKESDKTEELQKPKNNVKQTAESGARDKVAHQHSVVDKK